MSEAPERRPERQKPAFEAPNRPEPVAMEEAPKFEDLHVIEEEAPAPVASQPGREAP